MACRRPVGTQVEKVDALNYLAEAYYSSDPKRSIEISRQALSMAREGYYDEGIFYALNNLGSTFNGIGQQDSAYYYFERALALAIEMEDQYARSLVENNFGSYYLFRGNYPLALKYFQSSILNTDNSWGKLNLVDTYNNIGLIHEEHGQSGKSDLLLSRSRRDRFSKRR